VSYFTVAHVLQFTISYFKLRLIFYYYSEHERSKLNNVENYQLLITVTYLQL